MAGIGRFKWTVLPAAAGAAQDAASSHGWLRPNRLCRRIAMAERAAPLWLALGVASGLGTARRRRPDRAMGCPRVCLEGEVETRGFGRGDLPLAGKSHYVCLRPRRHSLTTF